MTDHYTPVMDAITALLAADTGVQALLGNPARIYDQRPAMATFPYLAQGEGEVRDISTKTLAVTSHVLQLQVFSRQRSSREARQVAAAIRTALHDASLTLASGSAARCQEEYVNVRWDEESQATRALLRYRVVVSG